MNKFEMDTHVKQLIYLNTNFNIEYKLKTWNKNLSYYPFVFFMLCKEIRLIKSKESLLKTCKL